MTESPVKTGEVYVKDLDGEKITNATLVNGRATINIPADDAGKLVVVVEYQENDIYRSKERAVPEHCHRYRLCYADTGSSGTA